MKKIASILFSIVMTSVVSAQTTYPKELTDPSMIESLTADLTFRNSQIVDHPVSWWDTGDSYYGTYSLGGEYMSWYNQDGTYIVTIAKKDWQDSGVPAKVRASYNQSLYKTSEVTSYWEITDQNRKGYYFELRNDSGKIVRIWANENGKFSSRP